MSPTLCIWRSGGDEGRGGLDWGCLKLLFDEKRGRGVTGVASHTSPSSALRPLSTIYRASPIDLTPALPPLIPDALWRILAYGRLVRVIICYPKDHTITLLLANVGELGAVSRRGSVFLPCMDLGLLWPLALPVQDARLRGLGPLGKAG